MQVKTRTEGETLHSDELDFRCCSFVENIDRSRMPPSIGAKRKKLVICACCLFSFSLFDDFKRKNSWRLCSKQIDEIAQSIIDVRNTFVVKRTSNQIFFFTLQKYLLKLDQTFSINEPTEKIVEIFYDDLRLITILNKQSRKNWN